MHLMTANTYLLCSCDQLIMQLNTLENVHIASQDHHTPTGVPGGKQQDRLPLSPSGTLGIGVAFRGIRRVVVHTILTVPLGQAMEPKPPPLPSSPTGTTPSRGISVTGWTKQNAWWRGSDGSRAGWMSLSACTRRYMRPSTRRLACCSTSSTTSALTQMLKSCKDLSLGEGPTD
jgi:hypothetical protein